MQQKPNMKEFLKAMGRMQDEDFVTSNEFQKMFNALLKAVKQSAVNNAGQIKELTLVADRKALELEKYFTSLLKQVDKRMAKVKDGSAGKDGETPMSGVDYPSYQEIRDFITEAVGELPKYNDAEEVVRSLVNVDFIKQELEALEGNDRLSFEAINGIETFIDETVRKMGAELRKGPMAITGGGTGGGGGGATTLDALTDTTLTSPTNGQLLQYNGSAWVNATVAGSGDMTAAVYDPAGKVEQVLTIGDKTGADAGVVSGTAGTNGNLSKWNADGDLVDTIIKEIRVANQLSSGLVEGGELSKNANPALFDVSDGNGVIVDNITDPDIPVIYNVSWTGLTAQTVTNLATQSVTHVYIDNTGAIFQASTAPTPTERRAYIYLGQLGHTNNTSIGAAVPSPDLFVSPVAQIRDLEQSLGVISTGNIITANGANLSINKSVGTLFSNGINFFSDDSNPSNKTYAAQTPVSMRLRTQTGNGSTTTTLDVGNYDLAGTITSIGATKAQNFRVYITTGGNVVVQYGQVLYNSLSAAASGLQSETFVRFANLGENSILIGIISALSNATDLSLATDAKFYTVSKFGEIGGAAAGVSVSTLQNVYENSTSPEITTNSTLGAVTVKRGSAADTDTVMEVQNAAGTVTQSVTGNGVINSAALTASELVLTDASKNLVSAAVATYPSLTELSYVKGLASDIQTQLNDRANKATSSLDNAIVRFDGTSGRSLQNSGIAIDDNGRLLVGVGAASAMIDVLGATTAGLQGLRIASDGATAISFSTFVTADSFTRFSFLTSGQLEWGDGTAVADTNLYRNAANELKTDDNLVIGAPGTGAGSAATVDGTQTLTNKRVTKRVGSATSSATPTINTDDYDAYHLTAQAADITSFTTNLSGTPTDFQQLRISVTGTAARNITDWGASFENGPVALPTATVTTTRLDVLLEYSTVSSKWRCMASGSAV